MHQASVSSFAFCIFLNAWLTHEPCHIIGMFFCEDCLFLTYEPPMCFCFTAVMLKLLAPQAGSVVGIHRVGLCTLRSGPIPPWPCATYIAPCSFWIRSHLYGLAPGTSIGPWLPQPRNNVCCMFWMYSLSSATLHSTEAVGRTPRRLISLQAWNDTDLNYSKIAGLNYTLHIPVDFSHAGFSISFVLSFSLGGGRSVIERTVYYMSDLIA